MAFFDELGKNISDSSKISKLNSLASDEQKRIDTLCMEIGKAYVELHSEDYEQGFAAQIAEIKASNMRIKDYTEQIKVLKGIFPCPNCGHDLTKEDVFCTGCGTRVVAPAPAGNVCTGCGAVLAEGAAFCTSCGTKVVAPAPVGNACVSCGSPLASGAAFCTKCGTKVAAPAPAAPVCAGCGATLESGAAFCTKCGTRTGETVPVTPVAPVQASEVVIEEPVVEETVAPVPVRAEEFAPEEACVEQIIPAPVEEEPQMAAPVIAQDSVISAPVEEAPAKCFCTNCGKQILATAKFCIYCGNKQII